jgi:predicted nucleic acid-binding protein
MLEGPVIANNTPLVALWTLGRLDILRDLYGQVWIPRAVYEEFLASEHAQRLAALREAPWIVTVSVSNRQHVKVYVGLDQGEAEVLALAEERAARLVIVDERKGRRYAQRLGIPLTGTLGTLLLAKERSLIGSLRPMLVELQNAGLYLDSALVDRALVLAGEAS